MVGDTFDESAKAAQEYTKSEGMTFIDPFDDYNVQAGQGTVAYEIYEQAQEEGVSFDSILVPVGGVDSSLVWLPISRMWHPL